MDSAPESTSGRRRKSYPPLGPGPPMSPPSQLAHNRMQRGKMFVLVVNGSTDHTLKIDAATFSDFIGISRTFYDLQGEKIVGNYLTCFPVEEHFQMLEKLEPPIHDIKYGQYGPQRKPLFVYTSTKYRNGADKFFQEIDPSEIQTEFLALIHRATTKLEVDDVINIIICSHGNRDGDIQLGNKKLTAETLANAFSKFKAGVQVNCVSLTCHSGVLVEKIRSSGQANRYAVAAAGPKQRHFATTRSPSNRCRNSRFTQPFIQSLAKIKLPGIPQYEPNPIRVEEHDKYMETAMRRVSPVSGPADHGSDYTFSYTPEQRYSVDLLEEVILRRYSDVLIESHEIHRRRRHEWPLMDHTILRTIMSHKGPYSSGAIEEVKNLANMLEASTPNAFDSSTVGESRLVSMISGPANPPWPDIIQDVYFRCRMQSACWDAFELLVELGFLDERTSLDEEMDLGNSTTEVNYIALLLGCFEFLDFRDTERDPIRRMFQFYDIPVQWLATTIARGCSDVNQMFDALHKSRIFGPLWNLNQFNEYVRKMNSEGVVLKRDPQNSKNKFPYRPIAFWLPHNLGPYEETYPQKIRDRINRFNYVEKIYKDVFELSDEELLLEQQQDGWFRSQPHRIPRLQHSGMWRQMSGSRELHTIAERLRLE